MCGTCLLLRRTCESCRAWLDGRAVNHRVLLSDYREAAELEAAAELRARSGSVG